MSTSRLLRALLCAAALQTSPCNAFSSAPISLSLSRALPQRCSHVAATQPLLPARQRQGCARLAMTLSDARPDTVAALKQEILAVAAPFGDPAVNVPLETRTLPPE
ncbi:hypothetical protein T484DRAFT_1807976 [Baffinella frigidus]|nr:hypothetical protein T484DRAFT_1807976 [Cryptophyta sp. CCMP2293]